VADRHSAEPSSGSLTVRFRLAPPLYQVVVACLAAAVVLINGQYLFVGVLLAIIIVLWVLQSTLIRLTADRAGVQVQNLAPERFAWNEIAEIDIVRFSWQRQGIELTLNGGRKKRSWAAKAGYKSGYSYTDIERIANRLRMMRREALGISDPPQLADALEAAKRGDPGPIDEMLAKHLIDSTLYEARLHELEQAGEIDAEALRSRRRQELGLD
jgi:hypothetical protein